MPTIRDLLFQYDRNRPTPFDKSGSVDVASKYAPTNSARGRRTNLCAGVIKALNAVCDCISHTVRGAVGTVDNYYIAEYKSSIAKEMHLVIYNSQNGNILASVYDLDAKTKTQYEIGAKKRDSAAIFMAMFPEFDKDEEFKDTFQEYCVERAAGYPDKDKASELIGVLCDNVYRRITDNNCEAHIAVNISETGNLARVTNTHIDSQEYIPKRLVAGEFEIFNNPKGTENLGRMKEVPPLTDFVAQYDFHKRTFSALEEMQIPKLPDWYILPKQVVQICKHAQATTGKNAQMRNFLMRGEAGSGKTMGAKAIAAGLNLPYMKYTCSADTEIYDFIGQIIPISNSDGETPKEINAELQQLQEMGGITYDNVAKLMNLPEFDCLDYDPESAYEQLTGEEKEGASVQECMQIIFDKVTEKIKSLTASSASNGQKFSYVETDFIRALKYGYCVEVQEPTLITRPGVLVGLNSLLEQGGTITLPTGEVIQRHPDAVVIITTNVSYEGCRALNQSLVDRMSLVVDVSLPMFDVMLERVMRVTGATNEYEVTKMVSVANKLATYCKENHITDGCVGMRSLIDWVMSAEITGDPHESALTTIISKATVDEDERRHLVETILEEVYPNPEEVAA